MAKPSGSQRKLFLNATYLFGGKAAAGGFAALQMVIMARILGVADFGLLQLVIAYIAMMNQLFDVRVWETAVKYIGTYWSANDADKTRAMIKLSYLLDVGSGAVSFVIAVLTAKLISDYVLHEPGAYVYIWVFALSLFIETAKLTSDAILRVFDKFRIIAIVNTLEKFVQLILVSAFLLLGKGIMGALYGLVISKFVTVIIRLTFVDRTLKEKGLRNWLMADLGLIRGEWREIGWFLGNTSLMATLKTGSDKYLGMMLLGYFAGNEAVGLYRVASSASGIVNRIVDTLNEAIFPELVRFTSASAISEFKKYIKASTKNLLKIIVPVTVAIVVLSEPIVKYIFGTEYLPAVNTLRILAVAVLVTRFTFWISPGLLAMGRSGVRTVFSVFTTVVYLGLMLILVPPYSYEGAALAFLGFAVIKSGMAYGIFGYYIKKDHG